MKDNEDFFFFFILAKQNGVCFFLNVLSLFETQKFNTFYELENCMSYTKSLR